MTAKENNMKYNIRRQGTLVGSFDNIVDAFAATISGDRVFVINKTNGDWGCVHEREVVHYGHGYAIKTAIPQMLNGVGWEIHIKDDYVYTPHLP